MRADVMDPVLDHPILIMYGNIFNIERVREIGQMVLKIRYNIKYNIYSYEFYIM